MIALRHERCLSIWNHAHQTQDLAKRHDPDHAPKPGQDEPIDYFLFNCGQRKVMVRGDGQVILPVASASLWERYMMGESVGDLARWIESALELSA